MKRWQALILFAVLTGLSVHGFKMVLALWTIEVYKQGVAAGFSACPEKTNYLADIYYDRIMPSGASKVIYLGTPKKVRE